jgi:hypothetical protein
LVQTAAFILGTLFVWAAVHQSILLVAVAVLAKALLVFPLHLGLVRRACGITLVQYARALRSPLLCTFAMVATVGLGQGWLPADFGPLPRLTFGVTTGVVSYILPMMLLFRRDIAPLFARNG